MAISQAKSKKSSSGAKYKAFRKKKQFELGGAPTLTKLGETKSRKIRTIGGNRKIRLLSHNYANVFDLTTKKVSKTRILNIIETPANRHFVRRNIITKGAIIETEKGKAAVTSRPGQEGVINAKLLK